MNIKESLYLLLIHLGISYRYIYYLSNFAFSQILLFKKGIHLRPVFPFESEYIYSYAIFNKKELNSELINFKKKLSNTSKQNLDRHINRLDSYVNNKIIEHKYDSEEIDLISLYERKGIRVAKETDYIFGDYFNFETLCMHSGLVLLKTSEKNYLKNKICIDCGAFVGDSSYVFSTYYSFDKTYSYEPLPSNFEKLSCNLKRFNQNNNIEFRNEGLGDKCKKSFMSEDGGSSIVGSTKNSQKIKIVTIDSCFTDQKIGFIKMDIEGSERNALLGAKKIIKKSKPIMSIAVYHNMNDLLNLYKIIDDASNFGYRYYLYKLNPHRPISELFLLCIPKVLKK